MMARSVLEEVLEGIIKGTADRVSSFGFVRRGSSLRAIVDGRCGIIDFQKSTKTTKQKLIFTINLAVVLEELLPNRKSDLKTVGVADAHFRERIGMLLPGRPDKWWEISNPADLDQLLPEVSSLVSERAAPYLKGYVDADDAIVSLWKSGKSPGLTEGQRIRNLANLASKSS